LHLTGCIYGDYANNKGKEMTHLEILTALEKQGITPYRIEQETPLTQAAISKWKSGKTSPNASSMAILETYAKEKGAI
jgi:transcriptional regulator with XRE-family HTH domain